MTLHWGHEVLLISQKCPSLWAHGSRCGRRGGEDRKCDISVLMRPAGCCFPTNEEEAAESDQEHLYVTVWPSLSVFSSLSKRLSTLRQVVRAVFSFLQHRAAAVWLPCTVVFCWTCFCSVLRLGGERTSKCIYLSA